MKGLIRGLGPRSTQVSTTALEFEDSEVLRQPRYCAADFMSLVLTLLSRGYVVECRAVMRASFHATVRNALDLVVGDIQYRDPSDEPNEIAQGISYGCHANDPQFVPDRTFALVMETLR